MLPLHKQTAISALKLRAIACTFVALASGAFGGYLGGQVAVNAHLHRCDRQPWGVSTLCKAWVMPGAWWQGGVAGMWTGTILGAFAGGLATAERLGQIQDRKNRK